MTSIRGGEITNTSITNKKTLKGRNLPLPKNLPKPSLRKRKPLKASKPKPNFNISPKLSKSRNAPSTQSTKSVSCTSKDSYTRKFIGILSIVTGNTRKIIWCNRTYSKRNRGNSWWRRWPGIFTKCTELSEFYMTKVFNLFIFDRSEVIIFIMINISKSAFKMGYTPSIKFLGPR